MILGYKLRQIKTDSLNLVRQLLGKAHKLFWLLLDFSKYKKIKTSKIKNLLIIYSAAIGDMFNAIGLINNLNKKYPKVNVYFLTEQRNKKFIKSPKINIVDLNKTKNMILNNQIDALILLHGAPLKKEIFDRDLYFKILKIPYRSYYEAAQINPKLFFKQLIPIFSTRKRYSNQKINGFQEQLDAFKMLGFDLGNPEFYYTRESKKYPNKFIKKYKIKKNEKIIFLHIGGGTITKALDKNKLPSHIWPSERWAEVADYLIKKYNARIIFTGVGREKELIDKVIKRIKNKKKIINLVDQTSIEESAALLSKGDLLITIDTGMAHIAAQTKIPIIDLFGPIRPSWCAPLRKTTNLFHPEVCHSCRQMHCPENNNICMKAITVKEVLDHAETLLKNK